MNITRGKQARPQRVCIYGPEGIGKSTLASKWPEPLFFDTESGTAHIDVARNEAPNWPMLVSDVYDAAQMSEFSTVVVDTLDAAEKACIEQVCKNHKKDGIEAFGYGKGYTYVSDEFAKLLNALNRCIENGKNVVVISHAQMRKFEQPDEAGAYDRWELKLSKKVAPMVKEWCDALIFLNYETIVETTGTGKTKARGGKRIMLVDHHVCWDAKNRWGLSGKLPMEFESIAEHILGGQTPAQAGNATTQVSAESASDRDGKDADVDDLTVLRNILYAAGFTEQHLERVVASKGFYPEGTTIEGYSDEFVRDMCLGQWDNLLPLLVEEASIPF